MKGYILLSFPGAIELQPIYDSVFMNARIGISLMDLEGTVVETNPAFCRIVGYDRDEIIGTKLSSVFCPVSQDEEVEKDVERFLKVEESDFSSCFQRRDGTLFRVRILTHRVEDKEQNFVGCVGFFTDVSQTIDSDAELREKRSFIKAIFDGTDDIIFSKDLEGKYYWVNKAYAKLFDCSADDIIGKTVFDLFPEEFADQLIKHDKDLLEGKTVSSFDIDIPVERGFVYNISKFPLHDVSGDVIGLCGIARDVSEQRRIEKALLTAQRTDAMIGLSASIAHDFNNIIMGISGYVTMALEMVGNDDPVRTDLEGISEILENAGAYTQKLLSLGNSLSTKITEGSMRQLVGDVISLAKRAFPAEIEIDFAEPAEERLVLMDRGKLEGAFINICVNARDAMSDGGRLSIVIDSITLKNEDHDYSTNVSPGDYCRVVFSDTGEGMSEDVAKRALEPFYTTRDAGEGAGLGLTIAYRIIREHRGGLKIESQEGEGTDIEVLIPFADQ